MAERTSVPCANCGASREISVRQLNRRRNAGKDNGVCGICRAHHEIIVMAEDKVFWLEQFTDDEIAVLASEVSGVKVSVEQVREMWPRDVLLREGKKR